MKFILNLFRYISFTALCLFFFQLSIVAQNESEIDSLLQKLKYAEDEHKSEIFNELSGSNWKISSDKMPVSLTHKIDTSFTTQEENYNPGTMLYLYSDGYSDQFGGQEGKKFLKNSFNN